VNLWGFYNPEGFFVFTEALLMKKRKQRFSEPSLSSPPLSEVQAVSDGWVDPTLNLV
jgi:hypothetical protein